MGGSPIPSPGIDGHKDALEAYSGIGWQGASVPLGPPNATDVVAALGQTLNVNPQAGQYSTLTLFATAVNSGDQTGQKFKVEYTDGTTQTFTRSFTNWLTYPGGYSDEVRVMETHAYNHNGSEMASPVYFSAYALPVNPTKTVKSIILPNDGNIVILAMELT